MLPPFTPVPFFESTYPRVLDYGGEAYNAEQCQGDKAYYVKVYGNEDMFVNGKPGIVLFIRAADSTLEVIDFFHNVDPAAKEAFRRDDWHGFASRGMRIINAVRVAAGVDRILLDDAWSGKHGE